MLPYVIAAIIGIVVGVAVGIPVGIQRRKQSAEQQIGSAEEEAKRIVNEAYKSAESKKREALVEAKEEKPFLTKSIEAVWSRFTFSVCAATDGVGSRRD